MIFKELLRAGTPEKSAIAKEEFSLLHDNQRSIKINLYERDIKNFPNAKKISDDGCIMMEEFTIDLPENLSKDRTKVELTLEIKEDGVMTLGAELRDNKGIIISKDLVIKREDDILE